MFFECRSIMVTIANQGDYNGAHLLWCNHNNAFGLLLYELSPFIKIHVTVAVLENGKWAKFVIHVHVWTALYLNCTKCVHEIPLGMDRKWNRIEWTVFQLGNEKGRAPGRALWAGRAHFRALWAREGTLSENKLCNCEKVIILLSWYMYK